MVVGGKTEGDGMVLDNSEGGDGCSVSQEGVDEGTGAIDEHRQTRGNNGAHNEKNPVRTVASRV